MRSLLLPFAALALLGLGGLCHGEPTADPFEIKPPPAPPRTVGVQVEFIEVSHQQLLDLLFTGDAPAADATPLRKKVQAMVKAGKATLLESALIATKDGMKATLGSQREWIYPTEFESWAVPRDIDPPGSPQQLTAEDRRGLEVMVAPLAVTSFETRNLGLELELEPEVADRVVLLRMSSSLAWPTGRTLVAQRKDSGGNVGRAELPEIYSVRIATALHCQPGRHVLAGVFAPMDAEGAVDPTRKVMVFTKCGVAGMGAGQPPEVGLDLLVSVHAAEMPRALAEELNAAKGDGDALFKKSQAWVKAGQAKLFDTSVIRAPSGEKGWIESVQEHISRSDYLDPDLVKKQPQKPPAPQIRLPKVPTTFETRNVGSSIEVEPVAGAASLDVRGEWEFELYTGDRIVSEWKDSLGNVHQNKRPNYVTFKVPFAQSLVSGKWQLVSMQSSSDPGGRIDSSRKLVVFVRADSLGAGEK